MSNIFLFKLKMNSGGAGNGKPWTHTYAISCDLVLGAAGWPAAIDEHVEAVWKPIYPSTVFFESVTISAPAKVAPGDPADGFDVYPLSMAGARTWDGAGGDRQALECCGIIKAFSGNGHSSNFWARGAVFEGETAFNAGGGWTYVPPSIGNLITVCANIDPQTLTLVPGKFNMKTRAVESFHPWTKVQFGGVRARQTTARKKVIKVNSSPGLVKTIGDALPLVAGALAFVLTKGKIGINPLARISTIASATSIGEMASNMIATLTAPDPTP